MAYIAQVPVGKHIYLYERESYRDKKDGGKVKSRKNNCIGKINPETGNPIYKAEYIKRMHLAGINVQTDEKQALFSIDDIKNSTIKEFGITTLLRTISNKNGMLDALNQSLPHHCEEVFLLACRLVANGEPFMHCQEWLESVDVTDNVGSMSTWQISRLLQDITVGEREEFLRQWADKRLEQEYLALDITSTSSYSELINDVEWGYNCDGEDLPQVNLCLLMGEKSRLPVYQMSYSGSIKDVSTLKCTLSKFNEIVGSKPIMTVMDKGFCSKKNVDEMLQMGTRFVISMPFTLKFTRERVDSCRDSIDAFKNSIIMGADTLRGLTTCENWDSYPIFSHVIYNPTAAVEDREKLVSEVTRMYECALLEPYKYISDKKIAKYISIKLIDNAYEVKVLDESVDEAKRYAGWIVLLSNHIKTATEAIKIYREKDVVEKGFMKLKNSLDLGRLRVHVDVAMQSKIFIGFIALIIMMAIHNVMVEKKLYKKWTMKQFLRILQKLRVQQIGVTRIETPFTKNQREIYTAFEL